MKFRKKPVVIEATQFLGADKGVPAGVEVHSACWDHFCPICGGARSVPGASRDVAFIRTLEGIMHVSPGDWVITGVEGERYPCKPEIFAKTYESADPR